MHVSLVIPAYNEQDTIETVVRKQRESIESELRRMQIAGRVEVFVADNASEDETAMLAERAGANVIWAPERGYGAACLAAVQALPGETDVIVFVDADGSDDPGDIAALLEPILRDEADFCVGSRVMGERLGMVEPGALTVPQRFGNRLATGLLRWRFGYPFTDLGPFRALRASALHRLDMDDRNFGWTLQMQARAVALGMRTREVPVHYTHRKGGKSKISGDLRGSFWAGTIILRTLWRESIWVRKSRRSGEK